MTGFNFTERVRKVLALAREDAESLQHEYIGTEHILLGLIDEAELPHGGGVGAAVLRNLGVGISGLRQQILEIVPHGKSAPASRDLPYTSRAKKVLELSMDEARSFDHQYVGSEHVLLGLLREEKGIAAQVLNSVGVTLDDARAETLRLIGAPSAARVVPRPSNRAAATPREFAHVKVAVVQAEVSPTLVEGLERTATLAHEAAASGAQVIVFPETWLPGYPAWLDVCRDAGLWNHEPVKKVFERFAAESVDVTGEHGLALSRLAAEVGAVLVIGVVERVAEGPGRGTLFNSVLIYSSSGQLLNHHRKLMPTYTERLVWGQGDANGLHAVDTPVARIGGLICWEHWMPLARQALHDSGEDIHAALWPTLSETHHIASRHYAFEGRCFVLAAASLMRASSLPKELEPHPDRVHGPEDWVLRGGSTIIGPDGAFIVEPVYDKPMILFAELDLGAVRREQMALDVSGHYARRDCFEFRVLREARSN
ncbi:MAG: nitrilase-related carbon-nitrogen hydrolase [Gemmatimonadaceae bacterium]